VHGIKLPIQTHPSTKGGCVFFMIFILFIGMEEQSQERSKKLQMILIGGIERKEKLKIHINLHYGR